MLKKMLPVGVVLLLTACNETGAHPAAAIAPQPAVERTAATDFDPGDTEQEQLEKAEARGAAQAKAAIKADDAAVRGRRE